MPNLDEVKQQVQNLGSFNKLIAFAEIKELPRILWEDERIEKIAVGLYDSCNGILAATNKRLIFVNKNIFKLRVEDFPYDKITSLQYRIGMLMGEITIFASGNRADIKNIEKAKNC